MKSTKTVQFFHYKVKLKIINCFQVVDKWKNTIIYQVDFIKSNQNMDTKQPSDNKKN